MAVSVYKARHYEIAGYGSVRTIAEQMGNQKVAKLLAQTLAEEEKTDKLITQLCTPLLQEASQATGDEEE